MFDSRYYSYRLPMSLLSLLSVSHPLRSTRVISPVPLQLCRLSWPIHLVIDLKPLQLSFFAAASSSSFFLFCCVCNFVRTNFIILFYSKLNLCNCFLIFSVQTTLPSIDFTRIRPHVNSEQHAMISDIQMEPVWVPVPSKSYGLLKNLLPPDSNLGPPSCETLSPYHRDWRPQHLSIPVLITNIECQNSIKTI